MALASTNGYSYVTVSSATQSDHISLQPGRTYVLHFSSAGAFVLDIQVGDGTNFSDLFNQLGVKVTIDSSTGEQNVQVAGGQCYRMDVDTYNNPITMTAREA